MCHCLYRQSCSMLQLLLLWDLWPFSCRAQAVVGHRLRLLPGPKACSGLSATTAPHSALESVVTPCYIAAPTVLPCSAKDPTCAFYCQSCVPCLHPLSPLAWDTGWAWLCWGQLLLWGSVRAATGEALAGKCGQPGCAREGLGAGTVGVSTAGAALPSILWWDSMPWENPPIPKASFPEHQSWERRSPGAGGCSRTGGR